ncbi:uncharacterized protein LOC126375658 isoform X2 [Pectinophora gossypiella]|uniref:uncharacterized protein LOC126375658 isoform X2 n=1 Tax=Pectinophora gossypiella TaxID=13191 RepID=UPI00214E0672|nr:uncharacterized protein LOC126375658 isoform X2 [Pectinophora gossypiella]
MSDYDSASEEIELLDEKSGKIAILIEAVRAGKRKYIYKCKKSVLKQICEAEDIKFSESDTVENLRKILSTYYQAQEQSLAVHQNKTMASNYDIKVFDGDNWETFQQQLECVIVFNDVPAAKMVPLLITKLSPKVFESLTYSCAPEKPITLTYSALCEKLKQKYEKTHSPLMDRAEFRGRNQLPTETIDDYLLTLRKLVKGCQFKDEEDQIKEKFIEGVYSKMIKFELLKQGEQLKLDSLIQLARTVESAYKHANGEKDISTVSYMKPRRNTPKLKTGHQKDRNSQPTNKNKCYCCGKDNHIKKDCTLRNKYCSECGQRGHIYKMCQQKNNTNILDVKCEEEDGEQALDAVKDLYTEYETFSMHSVSKIPPFILEIDLNLVHFTKRCI